MYAYVYVYGIYIWPYKNLTRLETEEPRKRSKQMRVYRYFDNVSELLMMQCNELLIADCSRMMVHC